MKSADSTQQTLIKMTHAAAVALADDLKFVRESLSKTTPSSGDVRRLSGIIRRMLQDNQLQAVASPRVGRVTIAVPDNREVLDASRGDFVSAGLARMFGHEALFEMMRRSEKSQDAADNEIRLGGGPLPMRALKTSALLSDPVARYNGVLITRGDFLKFVCYRDFGVHYGDSDKPKFDLIERVRNVLTFSRSQSGQMQITIDDLGSEPPPGSYMDLAHAHTFSTAYHVVHAADVLRLESCIEQENFTG
jgi:hypothetical protein